MHNKTLKYTLAIMFLFAFLFYYFSSAPSNKTDQVAEEKPTPPIFLNDQPYIPIDTSDVETNCSGGTLKIVKCVAETVTRETRKRRAVVQREQYKVVDTLFEFRKYLREPRLFSQSTFECPAIRDKYIKTLSTIYDTPKQDAIVNYRNKVLVFYFSHPYFKLPGNDTLPKKFSKQSAINIIQEKFTELDLEPGSQIYLGGDAEIYEMGFTANLFYEKIYMYDDYQYKIDLKTESTCK